MASAPVSWESTIIGQLRGARHWLHYTSPTHHIPYILVTPRCLAQPAMDNFTNCPAGGLSSGMAWLLTGDMLVGMRWQFIAWGTWGSAQCKVLLNACPSHFPDNAANLTHISGQFGTIQTCLPSKLGIRFRDDPQDQIVFY